jgi:hypothetical protein
MVKRFTRYWQDSQFREAIDREKARAKLKGEKEGWITYAIHDPMTPDYVGKFNTLIVYIGQSKIFGRGWTVDCARQVPRHAVRRAT